jgi:type II secretory pathway component GspD/PulD (secretin)
MKNKHSLASRFLIATALAFLYGCTSPKAPEAEPTPPPAVAPEVVAAENIFEAGKMQEAIIACIDISKKNPEAVGLADLQQRITQKLADERLADAEKKSEATEKILTADAKAYSVSPETYRQKKQVLGETTTLKAFPTAMQKALLEPIDLTLENADVNAIIAEIKKSTNINYIADSELVSTKKITARFEKTPLIEMLQYFDKNLDISFSVCSNLVWITQKEAPATGVPPMQTRVYRLRKGMVGSELGKTASGVSLFKGPEERGTSSSQQAPEAKDKKEGKVGLLEAIERFVPQPEGADFMFNDKVHALIVKNSLENLALVEDLVTAMDLRPLQVLIEARFITTSISDLRELGVDWLFQKPSTGTAVADIATVNALHAKQGLATTTADEIISIQNQINQLQPTTIVDNTFRGTVGSGGADAAYQFLLGKTGLQATLHALEKSGKSRTIVVPRVTTLNNREASFRVGEDVSYFEQVDTSIMTSGSNNTGGESRDNVTYNYDRPTIVQTGYSLIVTPSVGADLSTINLVLRPEISSVSKWEEYALSSLASTDSKKKDPTLKIPTISRQYIETEAVVRSGETVVLGGLADTLKSVDNSGTPWLSNLPWVGYLFKTENKKEEAKNVLIFVTATLISDVGEELIPLNALEHYGLPVPAEAKIPDVLKEAPAALPAPAQAAAPAPAATSPSPVAAP